MKKVLFLFIVILFPIVVWGYSDRIIPGGKTIGLEINTKGIMVVGFYKVNNQSINSSLKIGDTILEINDVEINSSKEFTDEIEKNIDKNISIVILRNEHKYDYNLQLLYYDGSYKTGLYVKDSVSGIGTMTYIDPETKVYGVLGHVINDSRSNKKIEIRKGYAFEADVTSFTKSINGQPGSKNANIVRSEKIGNILINSNYGVYGFVNDKPNEKTMKIERMINVKEGDAVLRTTNLDDEIKDYKINIIKINKDSKDKNFYFEVVDEELLKLTGGVVQGMSGSPIIQNDKIIGAVTRVVVDDVRKGYGISIITMLEEGDRIISEKS